MKDGPLQRAIKRYDGEVFDAASADAGRRKDLGLPDLSMKVGFVFVIIFGPAKIIYRFCDRLKIHGWNPTTPEEWAAECKY